MKVAVYLQTLKHGSSDVHLQTFCYLCSIAKS